MKEKKKKENNRLRQGTFKNLRQKKRVGERTSKI